MGIIHQFSCDSPLDIIVYLSCYFSWFLSSLSLLMFLCPLCIWLLLFSWFFSSFRCWFILRILLYVKLWQILDYRYVADFFSVFVCEIVEKSWTIVAAYFFSVFVCELMKNFGQSLLLTFSVCFMCEFAKDLGQSLLLIFVPCFMSEFVEDLGLLRIFSPCLCVNCIDLKIADILCYDYRWYFLYEFVTLLLYLWKWDRVSIFRSLST